MATDQLAMRTAGTAVDQDEAVEIRALQVALRILLDRYGIGPYDSCDILSRFSREDQLAFRRLLGHLKERIGGMNLGSPSASDPAPRRAILAAGDGVAARDGSRILPLPPRSATPTPQAPLPPPATTAKPRMQRPLALTWSAETQARAMNEPPTPGQLLALRQHGIVVVPPSKADASDLLRQLRLRGQP